MSLLGDGNGLFWFAPRHHIFAVPVLKTPHAERRGILWSYYATLPHVSNDVSCFADMCLGWRSSLTVSPQTSTERPSAKILKPSTNRLTTAFSSRWWSVWQFGHCQRSCNLSSTFLTWQMQHNFDDGKNVSTLTSVRPYHLHLYSSMRMKSPNPASEITRARRPFLSMALVRSVSTTITWFS